MESSVFKFIVRYSMRQQITVLIITSLSLPFYYLSLEIPKKIINRAVGVGENDLEHGALGPHIQPFDFFGITLFELDRLPLLFAFCGLYFALVLINGGFKYYINVFKGLIGERMLRRLRYQLFSRILRFPLPHFRKVSQGELIPMITAEVEPLGGFIGDAFTLPLYQGGLLVTALIFIMVQDWMLGLMALVFYPVQGFVIPKLQRRVNMLGKARVRAVRKLAERIGETVSGAQEIHANDTARFELADFSYRLGNIFHIRFDIYRKKFFVKFLNNFINQLTPLLFFSIGGYMVIQGELSIGALVAVMGAQKDIASPWRELLNFYQIQNDAKIKYEQVVTQFEPAGMRDAEDPEAEVDTTTPISGELKVTNLTLTDEDVKLIDSASFTIALDKRIAIVGAGGSGKEEIALVLGRLLKPSSGRIDVGGRDLQELSESVTGRRIAYTGATPFFVSASIGENLIYGLKHRAAAAVDGDDSEADADHLAAIKENVLAGNSGDDVFADWIDYEAAGVADLAELTASEIRALEIAEMIPDVYEFGLRGVIDPSARPDMAEHILTARTQMRERVAQPDCAGLVESFDVNAYNTNATVAENMLFGTPVGDAFDLDRMAENSHVMKVLESCNLVEPMLQSGHQVARTMIELFSDLDPDHEFFEQFSFIKADELDDYKAFLGRADYDNLAALEDDDRLRLLSLPFKLIVARHRLGVIDDRMQGLILEARTVFARDLPEELAESIEFFDAERYNAAASLQDNVLFGKLAHGQAQAETRVGGLISEVIEKLGIYNTVVEVGLDFQVGIGGTRLSSGQRQKLAIARAVLKRPDVFILAEATSALDGASQTKITSNLLAEFEGRGLIWILHRASQASQFDHVLVMRGGKIVGAGDYEELNKPDSHFNELLAAE
ncbi:MAG: ABC transporter ATP-binding protein [Alphaproteobacteria bacterium]